MAYSLTWLADVLRAAGLKVAETDGWQDRGHGEVGEIVGVMCHHTAGPAGGNMPCLGVVCDGRGPPNALAGPLCQLGLGRDGTWYVIAAGKAWHAGAGAWAGVSDGNGAFIGVEAENTGLAGDPWPDVQMDAYRHGVAALLAKLGAEAGMCCGHKEYALPAGRKDDPSFDMPAFRAAVSAILAGTAPPLPVIPAGEDGGRPTLRRGATGELVKTIQERVGADVDGVFGGRTEAAVRVFQKSRGLVPDGIVGPKTWAAIDGGRG
jgi:hypothetical protein